MAYSIRVGTPREWTACELPENEGPSNSYVEGPSFIKIWDKVVGGHSVECLLRSFYGDIPIGEKCPHGKDSLDRCLILERRRCKRRVPQVPIAMVDPPGVPQRPHKIV